MPEGQCWQPGGQPGCQQAGSKQAARCILLIPTNQSQPYKGARLPMQGGHGAYLALVVFHDNNSVRTKSVFGPGEVGGERFAGFLGGVRGKLTSNFEVVTFY